jgi:hypothetical protein
VTAPGLLNTVLWGVFRVGVRGLKRYGAIGLHFVGIWLWLLEGNVSGITMG